ncbi:MAG: DUF2029 domain-containing protein [Propionibacteriaceae bacterium]|nr:DUF2029 domain-containing protein [Propionibacteriaceae bacterium]
MSDLRLPAPARVGAAAGIGLGLAYVGVAIAALPAVQVDLGTYQAAVGRWLTGGSLYGPTSEGAFLYPPFAGLLLVPAVLLQAPVPAAINVAVHLVACVVLAVVLLVGCPSGPRGRVDGVLGFLLCTLALLASNPVVSGVYFGQVSLAVVTMVVLDSVVGPRWRGLLTGVAGAIKLWPLIMVPHYLLTRQWRAAANSAVGFGVATALGFVVAPTDSLRYWSGSVSVPTALAPFNKSLFALVHRWSLDPGLWIAGVVVIGAVALWRAGRHHRRGEGLAAVLVLGLATTLVSPLTWMHHLVWWPLAGLWLVLAGNRWQRLLGGLMIVSILSGSPLVPYTAEVAPGLDLLGDVFTVGSAVLVFTGLPGTARAEAVP